MKLRDISSKINELADKSPVVTLTGPRQSGKTTLVKSIFKDHRYVSLEDPDNKRYALEDPRGFLGQFKKGVILDEVQQTPDLFSYIQGIVDKEQRNAQFILTGSQNFLLMESISQSLAGRTSIFHLLPFAYSELKERHGIDPLEIKIKPENEEKNEDDIFEVLFKGFFPRIHDKNLSPQDWLADYLQTYIEKDVRQLTNVSDLETFRRFVSLCAGRSGQILDLSSLGNDCGVSHSTVKRWLSILQTSFQIFLLTPSHRNFNKRLIKSPKLYFYDTGLLCFLLRIRSPEELRNHSARGAIFESFVISEFIKKFYNQKRPSDLSYWRTSSGREIDMVIDKGNTFFPFEIKSGQTFNKDFLKGLNYWKEISQEKDCAVIYGGDRSFNYKEVPILSWKQL